MTHRRRNSETRRHDPTILSDRESSFHDSAVRWPASLPSAMSMAEAGFYFTPNDKNSDCCTCFRCGIKMFNWLPDDTPKSEHKKFSPSCKEVADVQVEQDRTINRAEQTDSRLRTKLADKARKLSIPFHRRHGSEIKQSRSNDAVHADHQSMPQSHQPSTDRPLNDEEKLAEVRRRREVAEKSLDGLEKLASFYPVGSQEQKRAEQSIILQAADLEKIRQEEERLVASMGTLSFGRGWHDVDTDTPEVHQYSSTYKTQQPASDETPFSDEESPSSSQGRAAMRPLPMLPSQLRNSAVPRMPTKMTRSQSIDNSAYDAALESEPQPEPVQSEWIEYFTEDGTPYYYSTVTKATVWHIPQPLPVA